MVTPRSVSTLITAKKVKIKILQKHCHKELQKSRYTSQKICLEALIPKPARKPATCSRGRVPERARRRRERCGDVQARRQPLRALPCLIPSSLSPSTAPSTRTDRRPLGMGAQGGLGLEKAKLNRAPEGKGPAAEGKGEAEGKELSLRQRCLHVPVLSPFGTLLPCHHVPSVWLHQLLRPAPVRSFLCAVCWGMVSEPQGSKATESM